MTEYKCIGCGAVLQSEDENESGFVPKSRIHEEDVICRRCFRLKNYNETPDVNIESGEFMTMLNSIYEKDGVIVKVIDLSLIHISEPTRRHHVSRMPSSA